MSEEKTKCFAETTSLTNADAKELFEFICTDILKVDIEEKRFKMKMTKGQTTTMADVIDLCKIHKIPVSFKVFYNEAPQVSKGNDQEQGVAGNTQSETLPEMIKREPTNIEQGAIPLAKPNPATGGLPPLPGKNPLE